jgi:Protein of unknown function (DUF3606)
LGSESALSGQWNLERIDVREARVVEYWMMAFSCNRHDLLDAVTAVGDLPAAVETYLQKLKGSRDNNAFTWF